MVDDEDEDSIKTLEEDENFMKAVKTDTKKEFAALGD